MDGFTKGAGMKALVTGANGFLGAWLVKGLIREGYQVSALVRKSSDLSELQGLNPHYVYGDVTDPASLEAAFKGQDIVFHLAGLVAYKKSDQQKLEKVNVEGTKNVVDACLKVGVPQLLHVSSVVAIGASFKPQPLTEDFTYNLGHLKLGYFDTKKRAEDIVISAALGGQIRAVCVNPSTIYGFGDARKGSRKNQVKVAKGKLPFYTNGGVNVVAVEDVVEGILLAVKNGKSGERYILAGENMTIKNLFEEIATAAGVKPPARLMPSWLLHSIGFVGDCLFPLGIDIGVSGINAYTATLFHWFDSSKAQRELGFKPTPAKLAIRRSVSWMKENGYLE
jgi:dihydroflavonol-4-reductase